MKKVSPHFHFVVEGSSGSICVHSLKELITEFNDKDYFDLDERKDYCLQPCQGIEYLHLNNGIHSDIKPANLLVSGTNDRITVKVTDFNDKAKFKQTCISTITGYGLKGNLREFWKKKIEGDFGEKKHCCLIFTVQGLHT